MKKVVRNIMLIAASCLVIVSCKKEDDDNSTGGSGGSTGSRTDLLANSWQMTNMQFAPPLDTFDIWSLIDPCEKDNIITFEKDGNGTENEGALKCDPNDPDTETFTWVWANNETSLTITDSDTVTIVNSVTFSGNTMTAVSADQGLEVTITFQKQ